MPRSLRCFFLLIGLSALGCNQCGERPRLFPRLQERLNPDGNHTESNNARRNGAGKDCGPDGVPVSRNGSGFGGETLSYPGNGGVIYNGPSYPSGQPYPANPRPDELPAPGGYITPPGVPSNPYPNAIPRAIDSTKTLPKTGGTMTGDPRK